MQTAFDNKPSFSWHFQIIWQRLVWWSHFQIKALRCVFGEERVVSFWSSSRIDTRTTFISGLYKWSTSWNNFNVKTFTDDISPFTKVLEINKSITELNTDLQRYKSLD